MAGTAPTATTGNKTVSAVCTGATPHLLGGGYTYGVSGGGAPTTNATIVQVWQNYPSSSTTWTVSAVNGHNTTSSSNSTAWTINAYAICGP